MKKHTSLLILWLVTSLNMVCQNTITIEEKVDELINLSGGKENFNEAIDNMVDLYKDKFGGFIEPDFYEEFRKEVKESGYEQLKPDLIPIYIDNFTEEEIDELIAFYKSDIGKSLVKKLPIIMQESMLVGADWGEKMGIEVYNKLQDANKELFEYELKEDCSKFKKGEFEYGDFDGLIKRKGKKQIEIIDGEEHNYIIEWQRNNRYLLTKLDEKGKPIEGRTVRVNIYKVEGDTYEYIANREGVDFFMKGTIIKIK